MRLRDLFFVTGTIESTGFLAGRMRRLRIACPAQSWKPGQQIRISVDGLMTRRSYSIWDGDDDGLELCVLDHGDGPGARWARTAEPGQELIFTKPEGSMIPRPAPYHLFVGEETASVAFGPMLRSLEGSPVHAVIEVDSPDECLPLKDVKWLYREGASAASSEPLVEAVRNLALPAEPGIAYVAGEARTVQAVRAHLVNDRGWDRRSVLTKPFWTPGKKGME
ncbi:siderophore-interacting protein [Actinomadura sp. 9N407]|uniref:siderophore-interacting protein n=1 Tax=Actinomadura sp. 9N407 TaxID=3375154 RepID=UPI0037BD03C4